MNRLQSNPLAPLLFLDFDGVCNSADYFNRLASEHGIVVVQGAQLFDPQAIAHLNRIVSSSGCLVVTTSSWRHSYHKSVLEGWMMEAGYEGRLDYSAPIYPRHRGDQIAIFLQHHREMLRTTTNPPYAIVDDEFTDEEKEQHPGRVVATTYQHGLTAELADRVIELMKGGPR